MKILMLLSVALLVYSPLSIESNQSAKVKRNQDEEKTSLRCLDSINDKLKKCRTKLINNVNSLFTQLFSFAACCNFAKYYECIGEEYHDECNNPNSVWLLKQTFKEVISSQSESCLEYHYHSLTCLSFFHFDWIISVIIILLLIGFVCWRRRRANLSRPLVLPLNVNDIGRKRFTHSWFIIRTIICWTRQIYYYWFN